MKITVRFNEEEKKMMKLIADGMAIFKNYFSFESDNSLISIMSKNDYENGNYAFTVNIDSGYMKDLLSMWAQHLPVISSSTFAILTSIRGMTIRASEIDKKYANNRAA